MTDSITRPLAALMAGLHPGWDIPGCAAAIHAARHMAPLDQLAHAVIAYAARDDVRTPALLAMDGPHWHTGRTPDARISTARCTEHPTEPAHACRSCAGDRLAGPDIVDPPRLTSDQVAVNARGAAAVRAELGGRRPVVADSRNRTPGSDETTTLG